MATSRTVSFLLLIQPKQNKVYNLSFKMFLITPISSKNKDSGPWNSILGHVDSDKIDTNGWSCRGKGKAVVQQCPVASGALLLLLGESGIFIFELKALLDTLDFTVSEQWLPSICLRAQPCKWLKLEGKDSKPLKMPRREIYLHQPSYTKMIISEMRSRANI